MYVVEFEVVENPPWATSLKRLSSASLTRVRSPVGGTGGGFSSYSDYVFGGTHDYGATNCYYYRYTSDDGNYHGSSGVNISCQRLGHPNKHTMQAARNTAETGVNFTDSLDAYNICKINEGTKLPIHNEPGKTDIMERLQFVITNLKYSDH